MCCARRAKEAAQFSFDCIAEDNVTARKTMEEGGVQFCDNPDIDSFKKKLDIPAYYTRYDSEAWYDQSLVVVFAAAQADFRMGLRLF